MKMKAYIIHEFGQKQGVSMIRDIIEECMALKRLCIGENAANAKTMQIKIFPRVAMYHTLQKSMSKQKAYDIVWNYTKACICTPIRRQYSKMERVSFFFSIYRKMFLHTALHRSEWSAEMSQDESNRFGFAIHRCLWNDTCFWIYAKSQVQPHSDTWYRWKYMRFHILQGVQQIRFV